VIILATEFYLGKRELISISDNEAVAYGTAADRKLLFGKEARVMPKNASNWLEVKGAGTDSIDIDEREIGVKGVGLNLEFVPQDWRFLKFVLCEKGTDVTDTVSGSDFIHTFTNSKLIGSFSLERGIKHTSEKARLYTGCQVNNFNLNFDAGAGGFVKCSADILARDVSNAGSITTLTRISTAGFKARHASVTINGAAETKCLSGNFVINNNLDAGRYANYDNDNLLKSESAVTTRRVSGSFVINLKDETYFNLWNALVTVPGACSLKLERGTNDYVTFTFNDLRLEDAPDDTNLEGINTVTVNWNAKSVSVVAKDKLNNYRTFT
jgi:hypothetical protein